MVRKYVISFFIFIPLLHSHPGRTIQSGENRGCHNNRKTNELHCHNKSSDKSSSQIPLKYNRKAFAHWLDEDNDCQNTRHEILISRSLSPVVLNKKNCLALTGKWQDFYYNEVLLKSSDIDIDHVVPLRHAFDSGASGWDSKRKAIFANDLENLVITNKKYNRQKGAQTISTWLPIQKDYACKYVKKWFYIKSKYSLSISKEEKKTRQELNCPNK